MPEYLPAYCTYRNLSTAYRQTSAECTYLYQKDNTSPFPLVRTHSETPASGMEWVLQIPIATTKKVSCCCMPVQPCWSLNCDLITTFSPLGADVHACFMLAQHTKSHMLHHHWHFPPRPGGSVVFPALLCDFDEK